MKTILISLMCLFSFSQINASNLLLSEKESITPIITTDLLSIMGLDGVIHTLSLGGSGAHGGDYNEMQVHNLGWQILERFKNIDSDINIKKYEDTLSLLVIEVVEKTKLNNVKRDAVNLPDRNKLFLTKEAFDFLTDQTESFDKRAQFFLHEFLPLMGTNDQGYEKSSNYVALISDRHDDKAYGMKRVLFVKNFGPNLSGITLETADNICKQVKKINKKKYFVTYCLYQEKTAIRYATRYVHYSSYEQMFFQYTHQEYTYFSHVPVLFGPIYGLKVIGFGPMEKLKEVSLLNGQETDMPTYGSYGEAMVMCAELVARENDENFLYIRAKCKPYKIESGYKFNIVTKNPLLQ